MSRIKQGKTMAMDVKKDGEISREEGTEEGFGEYDVNGDVIADPDVFMKESREMTENVEELSDATRGACRQLLALYSINDFSGNGLLDEGLLDLNNTPYCCRCFRAVITAALIENNLLLRSHSDDRRWKH